MDFKLKKPCDMCPFRTDCLRSWLGERRSREIAESIADHQQSFPCHKTIDYSEDDEGNEYRGLENSHHCAGSLILLEKIERPGQMMRIGERLGFYDRHALKMDAPVFDSIEDFIEHHS